MSHLEPDELDAQAHALTKAADHCYVHAIAANPGGPRTSGIVRIAHVVSHPIQYFAPVYRVIAERPDVALTVYFLSDASLRSYHDTGFGREIEWDVDLTAGYRHRILPEAEGRVPVGGLIQRPHWHLLRELGTVEYDVLWLHGYNHITIALAAAIGRIRDRRVILHEEQTLLESRPLHKQIAKDVGLRALFSGVNGLYLGQESERFFRYHGVPDSRLFKVPYCADSDYLERRARELAPEREAIRAKLGITDDAPVILFVGKLIERKAPQLLLAAFRKVRERQPCWLVFAGDGEQHEALEAEVRRSRVPNVRLLGFVNQTDLPEIYTAADVFTLPSLYRETWGVVVNEAMTFGLPVVISNHVGSAPDLVRPGWNGFVTTAGDIDELTTALSRLVESSELRLRLGANSHVLIADYSVAASAAGLVAAARGRSDGMS